MSQSRQQIKRTTVVSSSINNSNKQLQSTGVLPNSLNHHLSSTGYQGNTVITSSQVISSSGNIVQENYISHLSNRPKNLLGVEWQEDDKLLLSGQTDFVALKNMRNAMLQLINEFRVKGSLEFQGEYRQNFEKRLLLLEHQFDGLLRRVLNLNYIHPTGQRRSLNILDYIVNQNLNISKLEKQIDDLKAGAEPLRIKNRELIELNQHLSRQLSSKSDYIKELSRLLEEKLGYGSGSKGDSTQGYLASLETQIQNLKSKGATLPQLQSTVEGWILGLPNGSQLQRKLENGIKRVKEDEAYLNMVQKMKYAQTLFQKEMADLSVRESGVAFPWKSKILDILAAPNTKVSNVNVNGIIQIQREVTKQVQVGVQDARTKALIISLAKYVKRLLAKYPKLKQDLDIQLQEYITQEMIDYIVDGDIDRIISITKYVPQVVKVQNVYTHSTGKNRKVDLYLRVLIKALLGQLQRIKMANGLEIQLDQGILGMMTSETIDLDDIEVDSIIKMFRPIPKVVQVPKYIQKVVDNVITIPEKYVVKEKTAQIVPITKTEVVHDQRSVGFRHDNPVQIIKQVPVKAYDHVEKPVVYTQYRQIPVNQVIQKSKAVQVPTKVEVVVQKDRPVQIPGEDRIVVQKELQIQQVVKNEVRYIETVQQVIKPVEVIVQKIVQKMVQREKAVAVPVIQEKLVKQTVYQVVKENNPVLVTKYEIAHQTHQKIVQLIRDRDNIVPVPQVVQKLVPVQHRVQLPPKIIEVKQQVMVKEMVPEYVEIPKTEIVIQNQQVPVQIEKYTDRPVFVEVVKVQKEIANVPMITQITKQIHIPVQISKPCIVTQQVPVEVASSYPHFLKEQIPVIVKEEQTVPIPYYYDRIKPEVQTVQKIIEKIVQVPKCIQVQKIVEKIVIVPRIIEKIVEVPQIIEKIVQKIVQVPKELPPIQRIIERPCIVEVPVEIPVQRIVYLTVQKEKIVKEQVLVKDLQTKTVQVPHQIINQRVVVQTKEKPVEMYRDRVQYMHVEDIKVVKTDNVIVHPVQVPVPILLQKELPITIINETVNILPVPQVVQKIVPQIQQKIRIEKVDVVHNIPYIQDEVKIVDREKIIVQTKYEEVKLIEEKIVEVQTIIDQIKEVPTVFEQIVPVVKEVAKIYQFDKDPRIIETPAKVEIIQKVKPYIVNVNKYIERIVEKLVQVPYLIKETNVQDLVKDRIVPGPERHTRDAEIVQLNVEKQVLRQVEKKVIDTVHRIDEVMKCATQIIQRQRDPVIITKDKIIEVPYVLEKIVQKITVMPQVVEVLKHVVQIIDNDNINVLVDLDVEVEQYKTLSVTLQKEMVAFLDQLKKLKSSQPNLNGRIDIMERFLNDFKKYIKHPKLFQKIKEVKSEPVKQLVRVPHQKSPEQARQDLAKVLLIEQLLAAMRKLGAQNRNINLQNYIEKEVLMMFDINFNSSVKKVNQNFNSQLKKFQSSIESKFSKLNGWGTDHNLMLKSFIDERFQLANVIKRTKELNAQLTKENNQLRQKLQRERDVPVRIVQLLIEFNQFMPRILGVLDKDKHRELYDSYNKLIKKFQNFKKLYDSIITDPHFVRTLQLDDDFIQKYKGSCLREFYRQMEILREKLRNSNWRENDHGTCEATISKLRSDIFRLQAELRNANGRLLESDHSACQASISKLKSQIFRLQAQLRNANGRLYEYERRQDYQSPKRSDNTHVSNRDKKADESRYVPGSQSDVQAYGQNFGQYVISDPSQAGLLQGGTRRQNFQSYNSTVEQNQLPRDLTGSVATYRSNQVINSAQNIRVLNDNLSVQSNKKIVQGGNAVTYGSNMRYGSDHNLSTSQYQINTVGTGGQGLVSSSYGGSSYGGNGVKFTTSRITGANDGATITTKLEGSYSGREGVPTTTRKYQFHQKKYETGREG